MQRLAQIVACRRQKLRLAATGRLRRRAGAVGCGSLRLKLADKVDILVAHREGLRHQVIEVVAEPQNEREYDRQHRSDE